MDLSDVGSRTKIAYLMTGSMIIVQNINKLTLNTFEFGIRGNLDRNGEISNGWVRKLFNMSVFTLQN